MNVKELRELLKLVENIIDEEEVKVCIEDVRVRFRAFAEANVHFVKDDDGVVVLAVGCE